MNIVMVFATTTQKYLQICKNNAMRYSVSIRNK